jgi:hypothetical protein
MATETQASGHDEPVRLLARTPWDRWPVWRRGVALAGFALILVAVGYAGAQYYPDTAPPRGNDAERRISEVFGAPLAADGFLTGDLLVERFYAIDAETGEHYIADQLKGRVNRVQESVNEQGIITYALLLDLGNLQRDQALLSEFVEQVAPPDSEYGRYLGLRIPNGLNDAFPLNYDGLLPRERPEFHVQNFDDIYSFLTAQQYQDVTLGARLINVEGYNYLLSNTELWSYFRELFRVNKAHFMSELILVDMTARPQAAVYFRLLEKYPRR